VEFNQLPATEKENYLEFHKLSYKDDLKHAEKNVLEFPRWSVISGYYAMHDLTKLFLANKFSIKITSPEIHAKTIRAIEFYIKDDNLKKEILELLDKAKEIFFNAERLKEKIIPLLLKKGKQERAKSQYYAEDYTNEKKVNSQKAVYFLDEIVKPYIKIVEGLL